MERIREDEKERIKYILSNYAEDDPAYIEARKRVEYEVSCLKEEKQESIRMQVEVAKQIIGQLDLDSRYAIEKAIRQCKSTAGEEWLDKFEEEYENLGCGMAIAYEQVFGIVKE